MQRILYIIAALLLVACTRPSVYRNDSGRVFGTYYKVVYFANNDLHDGIVASMQRVNASLSTFDSTSIIARINRNDTTVVVDSLFALLFEKGQFIAAQTSGAFDITVAPLVNAWGFGFDPQKQFDEAKIDSIKQFVGFDKIALVEGRLQKADSRVQLDASAIAKGLGCDVVAHYLQSQGVENFLVDIGGEMVVKGKNPQGGPWRVGIQQPKEDSILVSNDVAAIVKASDVGIATSGNYRQFYYQGDKKISHTIDPRVGQPCHHNLLSVTVIAPDAMQADAYATAFMVLGDKDSIEAVANANKLAVYLLYAQNDSIVPVYNPAFKPYLVR